MRIPRIFSNQTLAVNTRIELHAESRHYLQKVLRLPLNAKVILFNGTGGQYQGRITELSKNTVAIQLDDFHEENLSSPLDIHLGIVISRGERMDIVIQKATELGVTSITPLFSERCEVKLKGERLEKKLTHWRKVSLSACEQSGLNIVPEINAAKQLDEWVIPDLTELKLILHPGTEKPLASGKNPKSVTLLIGPEGGFSEFEVSNALNAGFTALQLGQRILRTETAPITAISILQYRWGDLG